VKTLTFDFKGFDFECDPIGEESKDDFNIPLSP
jgi:hypothetical protein